MDLFSMYVDRYNFVFRSSKNIRYFVVLVSRRSIPFPKCYKIYTTTLKFLYKRPQDPIHPPIFH